MQTSQNQTNPNSYLKIKSFKLHLGIQILCFYGFTRKKIDDEEFK